MAELRDLIPDRYQDIKLLGSGAASSVYRVYDTRQNIYMAVKIARKEKFSQHIKKDFEILSELSHPNLCRVYSIDHNKTLGVVLLYSEYIDGLDILSASDPLDFGILTRRLKEICLALDYIHSRGLVHLDLKIDNILVKNHKEKYQGEIKVLDFGVARKLKDIRDKNISGTIHYIPPEMILHGKIDQKSDLYSLGVVLYRIVTARFPYEGDTFNTIIDNIINATPVAPHFINSDLPLHLGLIIEGLMQKEPRQRIGSIRDVLDIIGSYSDSYDMHHSYSRKALFPARFIGREELMDKVCDDIKGFFKKIKTDNAIFLQGEKGMGKTSVLSKINNNLLLSGITSILHSPRMGSKVPYEVIIDFLVLFMETNSGFCHKTEIRALLKLLQSESYEKKVFDKDLLFSEVLSFFRSIQINNKIVIMIDNLEYSGHSNLDLFNYMLPRLKDRNNLFFIFSSLKDAYEELYRKLSFKYCSYFLGSLKDEQAMEIMQSMVQKHSIPERIKNFIIKNSGGNPTLIIEMFKHIYKNYSRDLDIKDSFGPDLNVNALIRNIFSSRIRELSGPEVSFLQYASLFNLPFSMGTILEIVDSEINDVPMIVESLINKEILENVQGEVFIKFKRAIYSELIKNEIPQKLKTNIHRKISNFYKEKKQYYSEIPDEEIAYHLIEGRSSDEWQFLYSVIEKVFRKGGLDQAIEMLKLIIGYIKTDDPFYSDFIRQYLKFCYYEGNYKKLIVTLDTHLEKSKLNENLTNYLIIFKAKVYFALDKYDTGLKLLKDIENTVFKNSPIDIIAEFLLVKLKIYVRLDDFYKEVEGLTRKAVEFMTNNDLPKAIYYEFEMTFAEHCYLTHDYDMALKKWLSAYNYYKGINDLYGLSRATNNISLVYRINGDMSKALQFLNMSSDYDRMLNNMIGLAKTLGNIGVIHQSQSEYSKALRYYFESLSIREKLGASDINTMYGNILYIYYILGKYCHVFDILKKVPKVDRLKFGQEFYKQYIFKARCLMEIGNYEKAVRLVKKIEKDFNELGIEMLSILLRCCFCQGKTAEFNEVKRLFYDALLSNKHITDSYTSSIYEGLEFLLECNMLKAESPLVKLYIKKRIPKNRRPYKVNILYCLSLLENDPYKALQYISQAITIEKRSGRNFVLLRLYYRKAYILRELNQKKPFLNVIKNAEYYLNQLEKNIPLDMLKYFKKSYYCKHVHDLLVSNH